MSASLSVSIVTFGPDFAVLGATLRTLSASLEHARSARSLGTATLSVVDNGPGTGFAPRLRELLSKEIAAPAARDVLTGHGNVGYGRGHNLALLRSTADYHLVLNPDVELAVDAIDEGLRYMAANSEAVLLAPEARDSRGGTLFLCKRYPAVLDLALRGFAPPWLRRRSRARMERYEMRDLPRDAPARSVPIVSGAFMLWRRAALADLGGFSEAYFLYFEDFDLSLRAAARGVLAFVPSVRIVHHGGGVAGKGLRHVLLFFRSAVTFYNRHGWRWW